MSSRIQLIHMLSLMLSLSFLIACSTITPRATSSTQPTALPSTSRAISDAEYTVYAAILQRFGTRSVYVIRDATDTEDAKSDDTHIGTNSSALDTEMLRNFKQVNQQTSLLQPRFPIQTRYILASQEQLNSLFGQDLDTGWKNFDSAYPEARGYYSLSRVGFNRDMTQALVSYGNPRAALDGSGCYVVLNRVDGQWSIEQQTGCWVA